MTDLEKVKAHLYSLDAVLLERETRRSREKLDELLADDFIEVGSSGLMFDKAHVLERLPTEEGPIMTLTDFDARPLAQDVALTTYKVFNPLKGQHSWRSSIWKLDGEAWRMTFHQGTVTSA
ncbi:nuclear transport factor 2 family protein [Thalassobacillus hwangdonensis]|uniref:DUF4440 domain-containing protein n=1 Tax=Thalassobacillus hwangdonensis TaxID=546108 RepID=A0ABW3KYG4_9BACI